MYPGVVDRSISADTTQETTQAKLERYLSDPMTHDTHEQSPFPIQGTIRAS